MRYIFRPIYDAIRFHEQPSETHVDLIHRQLILSHACFFNVDSCTYSAQNTYREWMRNKKENKYVEMGMQNRTLDNSVSYSSLFFSLSFFFFFLFLFRISPNLKGLVYCTALREGAYHEWYFAYEQYKLTTSASEKELILDALGCTTKPWLLSKYLNMTISADSGIRKQDGRRGFIAVAKNSVGFEIALEFLMTNIKEISDYFGNGFETLAKMVDSITTFMNKDYHLERLKEFRKKADDLKLASVVKSIDLAMEKVKTNVHWRSQSYDELHKFLKTLADQIQFNIY